ncbi:copper resistance protein CopC [Bacillus subtilis]
MIRSLLRPAPLMLMLAGLAIAPLALAHPSLVRATPAADASVAPASQIELQFSEKVMPRATRIELSMDHGRMKMAMPTTAPPWTKTGTSRPSASTSISFSP